MSNWVTVTVRCDHCDWFCKDEKSSALSEFVAHMEKKHIDLFEKVKVKSNA